MLFMIFLWTHSYCYFKTAAVSCSGAGRPMLIVPWIVMQELDSLKVCASNTLLWAISVCLSWPGLEHVITNRNLGFEFCGGQR